MLLESDLVVQWQLHSSLKRLKFWVEKASIRICRSEALSRVVACGETILLQRAVDVRVLLEALQAVRGPALCRCHVRELRGSEYYETERRREEKSIVTIVS